MRRVEDQRDNVTGRRPACRAAGVRERYVILLGSLSDKETFHIRTRFLDMTNLLPDGEEHEPLLDTPDPSPRAPALRTPLWKRASPFWQVTLSRL